MIDSLIWNVARTFARFRVHVWRRTGIRIKGLGFLLRMLRSDRDFDAFGYRWHLDHRIASAYCSLLEGVFLEPETHAFLRHAAATARASFAFVDVGANIGEMVVDMAGRPQVARVIAFEPHPVCAAVCEANLRLSDRTGEVRCALVGDGSAQVFVIDAKEPQLSGISRADAGVAVVTTRLDDVLEDVANAVLLIDVEGAELDVLRGATSFIDRARPLIIFEYHDVTRQQFSLEQVRAVLGADYRIMRLRSDGKLDDRIENDTWNCAAFDVTSPWAEVCKTVMIPA